MKSNVYLFPDRKKKGNDKAVKANETKLSPAATPASNDGPLAGKGLLAGTKLSPDALRELAQSKSYNSGAVLKSSDASLDKTKPYQFNELQALTQNLNRLQNLHSRLRFMLTELEGIVIKD